MSIFACFLCAFDVFPSRFDSFDRFIHQTANRIQNQIERGRKCAYDDDELRNRISFTVAEDKCHFISMYKPYTHFNTHIFGCDLWFFFLQAGINYRPTKKKTLFFFFFGRRILCVPSNIFFRCCCWYVIWLIDRIQRSISLKNHLSDDVCVRECVLHAFWVALSHMQHKAHILVELIRVWSESNVKSLQSPKNETIAVLLFLLFHGFYLPVRHELCSK